MARDIPQLHRAASDAGAGHLRIPGREHPAVRAERHTVDGLGVRDDYGAELSVARDIPKPERAVSAADVVVGVAGHERPAVGAESHTQRGRCETQHGRRGPDERSAELPVGSDIPEPDRAVIVSGRQRPAVRAERQGLDGVGAGGDRRAELLVARDTPEADRALSGSVRVQVIITGRERPAVRAERHGLDGEGGDPRERCTELPVARDIPEPDRAVIAARRQRPAVRAERSVVHHSNVACERRPQLAILSVHRQNGGASVNRRRYPIGAHGEQTRDLKIMGTDSLVGE